MDKLYQDTIYKGLLKYSKTLKLVGYISSVERNRLLIADFLYNLLFGDFKMIPTENEYKLIMDSIRELSKCSCLIGCMYTYKEYDMNIFKVEDFRLYENNVIQFSENDIPKAIN